MRTRESNNSVVTWAPLGYYCSATGRLYKHRSEGASHHTGEPCCQPIVLAKKLEALQAAALPIVQRGQEARDFNERNPAAVQYGIARVALENVDALAAALEASRD